MARLSPKIIAIFLMFAAPVGGAATAQAQQKVAPKPLSASEQVAAGKSLITAGENLSQRVGRMLDDARRDGDIDLATCLSEALTKVDTQVGILKEHMTNLQKATDGETRKHSFTMMGVVGTKLRGYEQEAGKCTGQDMYKSGATKVVTEIDQALMPFENQAGTPPPTLVVGGGKPTVSRPASPKK